MEKGLVLNVLILAGMQPHDEVEGERGFKWEGYMGFLARKQNPNVSLIQGSTGSKGFIQSRALERRVAIKTN